MNTHRLQKHHRTNTYRGKNVHPRFQIIIDLLATLDCLHIQDFLEEMDGGQLLDEIEFRAAQKKIEASEEGVLEFINVWPQFVLVVVGAHRQYVE